jgi:hypothetical protein
MRERDAHELTCQLPPNLTPQSIAVWCFETAVPGLSWVARHQPTPLVPPFDAIPLMAFGVSASDNPGLYSAWGFGINHQHTLKAIPKITRFIQTTARRQFIMDQNPRRLEVRSLSNHDYANRWLPQLGFTKDGPLSQYGTGGEDFTLWSITKPRK